MRRFQKAIALVMVALWLPATLHCLLETVPGLEFLTCEFVEADAHQSTDCDADGCAVVESADYVSNGRELRDDPVLPPLGWPLVALGDSSPEGQKTISTAVSRSDPDLAPTRWQFLVRAAPSARAPSLRS